MNELLTRGINSIQSQITGERRVKHLRIPQKWTEETLNSIAEIDCETLKSSTDPEYLFRYIDISSVSTEKIKYPTESIRFSEAPSRARKIIRKNDVLIATVRPNLKAFAYFDRDGDNWIASTGFAVMRMNKFSDAKFLLYLMLSDDISQQIEKLVAGSNYPAINTSDIRSLTCLVPPLPEQKKIAAILTSIDDQVSAAKQKLNQTQSLKKSLMQDLLTGRVRVST